MTGNGSSKEHLVVAIQCREINTASVARKTGFSESYVRHLLYGRRDRASRNAMQKLAAVWGLESEQDVAWILQTLAKGGWK